MIVVVNFKTYPQSTLKNAVKLMRALEKVSKLAKVVAVPALYDMYHKTKVTVFAQHVDACSEGAHTGSVSPYTLKRMGVKGTLINHSEKSVTDIDKRVEECKMAGIQTIVCTPDEKLIRKVKVKPTYFAYEPPELIGGEVSVTSAKPEIVRKAVKATKVPVLCGAGVKGHEDLKTAIELGCVGVLIASGITKAKDQYKALVELIKGKKL